MADTFDPAPALEAISAHRSDPRRLVAVLLDVQERYGHLPREAIDLVAERMGVPRSRALHVATFYRALSLEKRGRTVVRVCKGTACHVRGAPMIEEELSRLLGVEIGGTSSQLDVTLESVACVGACAMAPVVVVGSRHVGQVTPARVRRIAKELHEGTGDAEPDAPHPEPEPWGSPRFDSAVSLDERRALARNASARVATRALVCAGTGCVAGGSLKVYERLLAAARAKGLDVAVTLSKCADGPRPVHLSPSGCHGFCQVGPLVHLLPADLLYTGVRPEDAEEIVEQTLVGGEPIERLLFTDPASGGRFRGRSDIPFYKGQQRVALEGCGLVDPESLDDSLAAGGFDAASRALAMEPERVVDLVTASGLRGRGGAGFPTGQKWRSCASAQGTPRSIVCNADEGDPGAFMDRSIMEGDPFRVVEGMIIGAWAVGATRGFVYVRAEYPLAVRRINHAVRVCRAAGLLGEGILGSSLTFDIEVVRGGGAFVCGEETALMRSLDGWAGEPRERPPYPAERGIEGGPTLINNVETWACVPPIVARGPEWFASMGTATSKGTKVFSLVGKVRSTGLVEVPMGTTLRTLVDQVGGGVPEGRALKAVQTGGPSGGCIPAAMADIPVDFEELARVGSMMGSGGLIVMDDRTCMVDVARYFTQFLASESCGKCMPCREGLTYMRDLLTKVCAGEASPGDVELLGDVARVVADCSLCGLGQTAANPVLSTLRYFADEYEAHVRDRRCPAGVCRALITFTIEETCTGCGTCAKLCPVIAISGERKKRHRIDVAACTRCGVCRAACKESAVVAR